MFMKRIFQNNTAEYGPNLASYPTKIMRVNSNTSQVKLTSVVSGQVYPEVLEFALIDSDGQIIEIEDSAVMRIRAVSEGATITGTTDAVTNRGIATFSDLVFTSKPGSKNVIYEIYSTAIDDDKVLLQLGSIDRLYIEASFRFCLSGEIEYNDE